MAASRSEIQAGRASVSLGVKNEAFLRGLAQAKRQLQEFGQALTGAGRSMMALGTAAAVPIGAAVKAFADFDDAMRAVRAVSSGTPEQFKRLDEVAKSLGASTSFTATQVAGLMGELGRAGFDPSQIEQMTLAVLDLARAGGVDATQASGIMAATLRQFGLGADQAARAADVLSKTANASFSSVEGLGESLSYAGAVAADAGVSIEDTLAILGGLGNVGIQGSEAGTALRRLLTLSGAEAEKLRGIFGVSFTDAAGNIRPLVDSLADVADATKDLDGATRSAKFNEAFGLLGITSASVIGRTAGDIRKLREEIGAAGGSARGAAEMMDGGLGGALRRVWSSVQSVGIALGQSLSGELAPLLARFQQVSQQVIAWIKANGDLVGMVAKIVAGITVLGGALVALGTTFSVAAAAVGGFSAAWTMAGSVVAAAGAVLGALATPAGILVAAYGAAAAAFLYLADPLKNLAPLLNTITGVASQLWQAFRQGDVAGFINGMMGGVSRLASTFTAAVSGMIETAKAKFWELWPTVQKVFGALLSLGMDVFDQLPKFAGYAAGRLVRALFDAFVWMQKKTLTTLWAIITGAFKMLVGLGPELIKAIFTGGGWSGVAKILAKQLAFVSGAIAGVTASAAPGLELSAETRAAFADLSPGKPAAEATRPVPAAAATPAPTVTVPQQAAQKVAAAAAANDPKKMAEALAEFRKEIIDQAPLEKFRERLVDLNEGLARGAITSREWRAEVAKAKEEFLKIEPPPLDVYVARLRDLHAAFQAGAITGEQFAEQLSKTRAEVFDLSAAPLDQFRDRVRQLDAAFYAQAITLEEYQQRVRDAKEEILGLDVGPLDAFARRADELRRQLAAGAITQSEYTRAFGEAQKSFIGADANPIDEYKRKIDELRGALAQGLINPQQFEAAAKAAVPDSVKSIVDQTRTPMEKYRQQLAELNKIRESGAIDQTTYDRRKQQLQADTAGGSQQMGGSFSAAALLASARGQGAASPQDQIRQALRDQAEAQRVNAAAAAALAEEQRRTLAAIREFLRNQRHG